MVPPRPHPATTPRLLAESAPLVDAYLSRAMDESLTAWLAPNLREAINYSLLSGGKRLRPALVLGCCDVLGGDRHLAMPPAAAIEMIHCFSLVHDDLPAMDDDDLRRGRPTSHVKFGEAMAILVGDALAILPFVLIQREVDDPTIAAGMIGELSQATMSMITGQVFDTLGGMDEDATDEVRLEQVHRNKTGALIRASCRLGALASGAPIDGPDVQTLTTYGEHLGLMFQIVDDVLDVTQSAEHLGKRTGKDEAAGKLTYPVIHGIDESIRRVHDLRDEAASLLAPFGDRAQNLVELCEFLATRTK